MFSIVYKKSKPGVKGVFDRKERINLINHEKRQTARKAIIAAERLRCRDEAAGRKEIFRSVKAQLANPEQKVKKDAKGNLFIQPRVKGKFQARQVIEV